MLLFSDKRRSGGIAFFSILYSCQWPNKGLKASKISKQSVKMNHDRCKHPESRSLQCKSTLPPKNSEELLCEFCHMYIRCKKIWYGVQFRTVFSLRNLRQFWLYSRYTLKKPNSETPDFFSKEKKICIHMITRKHTECQCSHRSRHKSHRQGHRFHHFDIGISCCILVRRCLQDNGSGSCKPKQNGISGRIPVEIGQDIR